MTELEVYLKKLNKKRTQLLCNFIAWSTQKKFLIVGDITYVSFLKKGFCLFNKNETHKMQSCGSGEQTLKKDATPIANAGDVLH
jgi:hypothetical protein